MATPRRLLVRRSRRVSPPSDVDVVRLRVDSSLGRKRDANCRLVPGHGLHAHSERFDERSKRTGVHSAINSTTHYESRYFQVLHTESYSTICVILLVSVVPPTDLNVTWFDDGFRLRWLVNDTCPTVYNISYCQMNESRCFSSALLSNGTDVSTTIDGRRLVPAATYEIKVKSEWSDVWSESVSVTNGRKSLTAEIGEESKNRNFVFFPFSPSIPDNCLACFVERQRRRRRRSVRMFSDGISRSNCPLDSRRTQSHNRCAI